MKNFFVGDIVTDTENIIHYKILNVSKYYETEEVEMEIIKSDDSTLIGKIVEVYTTQLILIKRPFMNKLQSIFKMRKI